MRERHREDSHKDSSLLTRLSYFFWIRMAEELTAEQKDCMVGESLKFLQCRQTVPQKRFYKRCMQKGIGNGVLTHVNNARSLRRFLSNCCANVSNGQGGGRAGTQKLLLRIRKGLLQWRCAYNSFTLVNSNTQYIHN